MQKFLILKMSLFLMLFLRSQLIESFEELKKNKNTTQETPVPHPKLMRSMELTAGPGTKTKG